MEAYFILDISNNEKFFFRAVNKEVKARNKLRIFLINYDYLK